MNTRIIDIFAAVAFFAAAALSYRYDAEGSLGITFIVLGGVFLGAAGSKNGWSSNLRQKNKTLWTTIIVIASIVVLGGLSVLLLLSK